jgi:fatty acid desaturase
MTIDPAPFEIKDLTQVPTYTEGLLSRWCKGALHEERDQVFVRLTIKVIAVMSLAMIGLYASFRWTLVPIWISIPLYLALWGWYATPVILMLHNTMHRPFIRQPKWLNRAHPFAMSFFFGVPTGYADHHLGMHHVEDNMPKDLSSTMRYQRDSFLHFLAYFGRFFFLIAIQLPLYLLRNRRVAMARRAFFGELAQQAVLVSALVLDWRFGLVAFAIPTLAIRFLMMAGNWGQHAFLNTARKNDGLSNSITCINSGYNRRAFNDGYHIGHHLKGNRHWTELPQDLVDNRELYAREGAIVFDGLDFFLVSFHLWTGRWDVLAKRFVRLDGRPRSDEEVIAMLRSRVQPIRAWTAESTATGA